MPAVREQPGARTGDPGKQFGRGFATGDGIGGGRNVHCAIRLHEAHDRRGAGRRNALGPDAPHHPSDIARAVAAGAGLRSSGPDVAMLRKAAFWVRVLAEATARVVNNNA